MTTVRLATLADTTAIVDIHKSHQIAWERLDAATGQLVMAPYEALDLYERWQHGGPWMSIETGAVHLNRLLAGSGVPLVAEDNQGHVSAEAEVYESFEPAPFGHHLHIASLITFADQPGQELSAALVKYIIEMARLMKCERVTTSDSNARDFYVTQGFRHTRSGRGVRIPTAQGRAFYQSTDLVDRSAEQIKSWHMPLGRYETSRQEWDELFPQDWAAGIPELLNVSTAHVKLTVTGQNAIIYLREADEPDSKPGDVDVACWAARPLSNPLLTAIRDRAFRDGFQTILTYVMDADLPLLGTDYEATGFEQDMYELPI